MQTTAGQAKLDAALRRDQIRAKEMRHDRKQGLTMSVSREAFFNAVQSEGQAVATKEGAAYWKDMRRRYPHLNMSGRAVDTGENIAGTRNRFGKVARRFTVARGWEVNVGGRWVAERVNR